MYNLLNSIIEKTNETTFQSNIAYIPGGFGSVSNVLKVLKGMKKQWKIDILEDGVNYKVKIEDKVTINVHKNHWKQFEENLIKSGVMVTSIGYLDLSEDKESRTTNSTLNSIRRNLFDLFKDEPIRDVKRDIGLWRNKFGAKKYLATNEILLNYGKSNYQVDDIIKTLEEYYEGDVGSLQLILEAVGSKEEPLNTFLPFQKYKYLYGATIWSIPEKVNLKATFLVDFTYKVIEQIETKDRDVLEQLAESKLVNVNVKLGIITPKTTVGFSNEFFSELQNILEES